MSNEQTFPEFLNNDNVEQQRQTQSSNPNLRSELLALAESGEIKYTPKHIKKANQDALEKIMRDYKRKQTEAVNEYISGELISKLTNLMDSLDMVDDATGMEKELTKNKLLKQDLKNIVGHITPYIPLIGLVCGGAIVGKHVFTKSTKKVEKVVVEQNTEPEQTNN